MRPPSLARDGSWGSWAAPFHTIDARLHTLLSLSVTDEHLTLWKPSNAVSGNTDIPVHYCADTFANDGSAELSVPTK